MLGAIIFGMAVGVILGALFEHWRHERFRARRLDLYTSDVEALAALMQFDAAATALKRPDLRTFEDMPERRDVH